MLLRPCTIFPDPFRGAPNLIVLCDCLAPDMTPIPSNTRAPAAATFVKKMDEIPWFGLEQVSAAMARPWRGGSRECSRRHAGHT